MEVDLIKVTKVEGGWPKQKDGSPDLREDLKNLVRWIMDQVGAGQLNDCDGINALTTLPGGYPSAADDLVIRVQVIKACEGTHRVVAMLATVNEPELAADVANLAFLDGDELHAEELRLIPATARAAQKLQERELARLEKWLSGTRNR